LNLGERSLKFKGGVLSRCEAVETGPSGSIPCGDELGVRDLDDPIRVVMEKRHEPSSDDGSGFRYVEGVETEGLIPEIDRSS
jgi:hypothetical protein